jgi:hypothetical protein
MSKKPKESKSLDIFIGIMLLVVVAIMPIVVQAVFRPLPEELLPYFPESQFQFGIYTDMFSYWKGIFVMLPAGAIAFFYVNDLITRGKMPKLREFFSRPYVVLSMIYLAFVIISAIFSSYSRTSWLGTYERNEGALMWLSYFVIFFAAMYFSREIEHTKIILIGLAFSSVIMGAIGVSQFVGHDFFATELGRLYVTFTDSRIMQQRDEINPAFPMAYGTLYNPNTFGKYTAMLSPVLLLAALTYSGKKIVNVALLVAGLLMLVGVFGSSSLGGLVGIITASGVLIVTFALGRGIPWKRLAVAAVPVVVVLGLAILFFPPLNYRVNFLFGRLGEAMRAETAAIQNYIFEENTMAVYGEHGKILSMTLQNFAGGGLTLRGADGNEIPPVSVTVPPPVRPTPEDEPQVPVPTVYVFYVPNYRTIVIEKFQRERVLLYYLTMPDPFALTLEDGRFYGLSLNLNLVDLSPEIPSWGFYGRETWGSNRGYIWSRSFPLMPSRTIIGSGPDTFINVFPNHDMVSGLRFFLTPNAFVDKAHNFFIQTWISTGGISAIALTALFGHYIFTTFWSLIKRKNNEEAEPIFSYGLRLGLLCGVSAYVMSGMATDTTIGSTGVFFVLLGVGYGLNFYRRKMVA